MAGLRNTSEAISRLPGHIEFGTILALLFRKILRQSPRLRELLVPLGSGQSAAEKQEGLSAELDTLLVSARECLSKVLHCSDTEPVDTGECSTNIRAELLNRWADAARDPGTGVCEWLKFGAHAGLSADPTGIDGVFTRADDKTSPSGCLFEEFVAHSKAAQDDEGKDQIRQCADQGWLEQTSREELERSYGRDYTVSDFCVVAKEKQGKVKKRLILDLKRSGISNRRAIAIRGTEQQRDEFVAVAVLVWRILGFDLSFHKAQRDHSHMDWGAD